MALVNAVSALSCYGGYVNSCVTSDLRSYGPFTGWPPEVADIGRAPVVAMTHVVADGHSYAINCTSVGSYFNDYYNRIHIIPDVIDVGNLLANQTRIIDVWNAWITKSMALDSVVVTNGSGMTLTAPGPLPLVFATLEMKEWSLEVDTKGSPLIDASIEWVYADSTKVSIDVTGKRLTVWFVLPDWSNGVLETLEWKTAVESAFDGSEDRTPLRAAPRRSWDINVIMGGVTRQAAEGVLFSWRAQNWAFPVWADRTQLSTPLPAGSLSIALDTTNLDFSIGGTALIRQSDTLYEVVEISDLTSNSIQLARATTKNWNPGVLIYPCRSAQLSTTPQLTRKSSDVLTATLTFSVIEDCSWPAIAPSATYLGIPVLEDRIDETDDPTAQYDRILYTLDNDLTYPEVNDPSGFSFPLQSHAWLLRDRPTRSVHRSLLYWLQGMSQTLWIPSWNDDLTLASQMAGVDVAMTVKWCGVSLYLQGQAGRKRIRIELYDGSIFYRTVQAATDLGDGTEQLQIEASLGVTVIPSQVRQISWMMLGRLAGDSVQINHIVDSLGAAKCAVNFTGVPAEEPA